MTITRETVVEKLAAYLRHGVSLAELVDWAEFAMMEGDFQGEAAEDARDVVARLGVADVRAFGLTWEDCEHLLKKLGCTVRLEIGMDEVIPLPEGTVVTVEPVKQEPSAVGRALLDLAGLFPPEDLQEIEEAVQDCRKVDPDGW